MSACLLTQEGETSANTLPDEDARLHSQAVQALEKLYALRPNHLEGLIVGACTFWSSHLSRIKGCGIPNCFELFRAAVSRCAHPGTVLAMQAWPMCSAWGAPENGQLLTLEVSNNVSL